MTSRRLEGLGGLALEARSTAFFSHSRRPAGPDPPRETVFGFCSGTGSTVGVSGAAQSSASLLMGLSR